MKKSLSLLTIVTLLISIQSCTNANQKDKSFFDVLAGGEENPQIEFLMENEKKDGIITTESGLQYSVITEGNGPKPKNNSVVKVHYRGTLINGKEFDSSYKKGKPISFQLNRVIKGWTEGLQLMSVGSKYRFFIPSYLGYGKRGAGRLIGPGTTLIFDVELLDIVR